MIFAGCPSFFGWGRRAVIFQLSGFHCRSQVVFLGLRPFFSEGSRVRGCNASSWECPGGGGGVSKLDGDLGT